eukprot:m.458558 g.458558  ORF g.458558 m.458558 type:complete len:73 (+) comp21532_c0_seq1:50-268(+)
MSGRAGSRFVVSAVLGAMALAIYPTIIHPILMEDEYAKMQEKLLKERGLTKEDIQPPSLPVWSDPFAPKKPR